MNAPTSPRPVDAVLLDFDGVVLDSVLLKEEQFRSMIAERLPDQLDDAMKYFWTHGGVSRVEKFRWIWANLAKAPLRPGQAEELGAEFARRVRVAVLTCPYIPGAHEFLEKFHRRTNLYVISGTPQEELRSIVRERGMDHYFRGVFGSPRDKVTIGGEILHEGGYRPSASWFVGDATTDRDAARALGVGFVGIAGPHLSPYLEGWEVVVEDLRPLADRIGLAP